MFETILENQRRSKQSDANSPTTGASKDILDSDSIPNGALCAVLTRTDLENSSEDWILANVVRKRQEESGIFYEVVDAEILDETATPKKNLKRKAPNSPLLGGEKPFSIPPDKILLIPKNDEDALANGEFGVKDKVLALFPGTTAFYEALVISNPSKRKKSMDYLVKFTDDTISSRACAPRFVLALPQ